MNPPFSSHLIYFPANVFKNKTTVREIHQRRPTLIWWMRLRPSSFIIICLFSSRLTLGFGWGLVPGWGWSLGMDGVCWSDCGRETPEESFPDRLHISHTREGLVFTKVQNWHIHWERERRERKLNTEVDITGWLFIRFGLFKPPINRPGDKPLFRSQAGILGWTAPVRLEGE